MLRYVNTFFLCFAICCLWSACHATGAEVSAAVAGVSASVAGIVDAVAPLMTPEQAAKLHSIAHGIDGSVAATQTAVGAIADVITNFKTAVAGQMEAVNASVSKLSATVSTMPTQTEVLATNAVAAGVGTAASRALSAAKHGFIGKKV